MHGSNPHARICGAKTRSGKPCQNTAVMRNGRCRMHGGATPKGTDLPQFSHGGYSDSIPDALVETYQRSLQDDDRHDLKHEIALGRTKVQDLIKRSQQGESDSLWLELRALEGETRRSTAERRDAIIGSILEVIRQGGDQAAAWTDIDRWLGRVRNLTETDIRMAQVKQEMVSVEEVMALGAAMLDAIRRHVESEETRRALGREIRQAFGDGGGTVTSIERARGA